MTEHAPSIVLPEAEVLVHRHLLADLRALAGDERSWVYQVGGVPRDAYSIERIHRALRGEVIRLEKRLRVEGILGRLGHAADALLDEARVRRAAAKKTRRKR